jgi:hypothetical protein
MERPGAHCADIIEWHAIASVCPQEAAILEALLRECGCEPDALPTLETEPAAAEELFGAAVEAIRLAWENVKRAFEANTSVGGSGLRLCCGYHEPDKGGPYDEVFYEFFYLEGCYQLSPAGQKFQSLFQRRSWVKNEK